MARVAPKAWTGSWRRAARRPIPLVGGGADEVCPVHVDDVTAALAAALDAPAGRIYTLAGECMSTRAFAYPCIDAFGGGRIVPVPVTAVRALSLAARVAPLPLYPDQLARLRAPKPPPSPRQPPISASRPTAARRVAGA